MFSVTILGFYRMLSPQWCSTENQMHRKFDLLLLVLVLLEWCLWAALKSLPHQRLSCDPSPIEGVHFLFQFSSLLLQILLFFLVHPLELLKPLMKLEDMMMMGWDGAQCETDQMGYTLNEWLFYVYVKPLFPFLSAQPRSPSLCWQTFVSFLPLCAADPQGTPSSWLRMCPEG